MLEPVNRKSAEPVQNEFSASEIRDLYIRFADLKDRMLFVETHKEAGEMLKSLLQRREKGEVRHIKPTEIFPGYEGYHGTYNVSHDHISRIIPGYQAPAAELLELRKKIAAENYGTMPGSEAATAIEITRALRPRTIFEIGTNKGILLKALMQYAPEDCFAIMDLPYSQWGEAKYPFDANQKDYVKFDESRIGEEIRNNQELNSRAVLVAGDSGRFDFSHFYGLMDLVVVDGNHTYENARHDLEEGLKLVSPGGVLLIDDVNKPFRLEGVTLAVLEQTYKEGKVFYYANHKDGPDGNLAFYINS